jgi:hypothetical protein
MGHREGVRLLSLGVAVTCAPTGVAASAGKVFGAGVDFSWVGLMMIGIIIFTVAFELLTDLLEYKLAGQATYLEMVHKVYTELMILGFLSFALSMIVEFGAELDHTMLMSFEWAHMLIFTVAILYVRVTKLPPRSRVLRTDVSGGAG